MSRASIREPRVPIALGPDERELASVVRDFLGSTVGAVTAARSSWPAVDPSGAVWQRMAGEVGLHGLALPESVGGQGFGIREAAVVAEELGRSLCPAPLLGTVALASRLILACPQSTDRDELLAAIATGGLRATAGFAGDSDLGTPVAGRISGATRPLVDGDVADVAVLAVPGAVVVVRVADDGVTRACRESIDLTRGFASLALTEAAVTVLATGEAATTAASVGVAEARTLLAAEIVGNARAALEEAVAYSTVRVQFGRQIGSFQALKHRMADVLIDVEAAWSATRYAAGLADLAPPPSTDALLLAAGVAKGSASRAARLATAEGIQIHGGIGFTWEHTAHLRFRRATSTSVVLGDPASHHDRALGLMSSTDGGGV